MMSGVRPARLIETSCQINKNLTSPSADAKSSTCLLHMTFEEPASLEGEEPKRRAITIDLPPANLNALVDDFTAIREQLANVRRYC